MDKTVLGRIGQSCATGATTTRRRVRRAATVALAPWVRYRTLMAMDKLAELIDAARTLSPEERRRLIVELDALEIADPLKSSPTTEPFAALRALSGSVHSEFADISTDKYAHVAAATGDPVR
jgi:hypothetical protein